MNVEPQVNRNRALALLSVAQFMVVVDSAVVNVAIPSIQSDLHFSGSNIQWVFNAYLLAYGGLLLLGGRMADVIGRRRMFIAGAGLMSVASLVAGLSQSQAQLVTARAIQGVGAALITPAALSTILFLFRSNTDRSKALGIWGALGGVGAAAGVLLGGVITQGPGWQWIFYVNIPVAVAVGLLSVRLIPETRADLATRRFDLPGGMSITAGVSVVVYSVIEAPSRGWGSFATIGLLALGIALIGVFVLIELRTRQPLMRLGLLRTSTVAGANAITFMIFGAFFGILFILTLYMQQVLGYSAIRTGVSYLPLALGTVVSAVVASQIVTKCGVKFMLLLGALPMLAGLGILSRVTATSSWASTLLPAFLLLALGMGFSMVSLSIAAFAGVSDEDYGVASGLYNTSSQIGGAVGVAILSTVAYSRLLSGRTPHSLASRAALSASAYGDAFTAAIGIVAASLIVTVLVVRSREVKTWTCATPFRMAELHSVALVPTQAAVDPERGSPVGHI